VKNIRDAIELGHLAVRSGDGHTVIQTSVLDSDPVGVDVGRGRGCIAVGVRGGER